MQKNKINKFYLVLLALCISFHAQPMDQPNRDIFIVGWVAAVGAILLGASTIRDLLQTPETSPFSFTELSEDMQNEIITLLSLNTTADTLEDAAYTIRALSRVNKKLNQKINNPAFCLQLIKSLSEKFECSNMDACKALQTKAAKERETLQNRLYKLCDHTAMGLSESDIDDEFIFLSENGIDLEFTYSEHMVPYKKDSIILFLTPLMLASIKNHRLVPILLNKNANINAVEPKYQLTSLMLAAIFKNNLSVELLCKNKEIFIDQKDRNGNTALLLSIMPTPYELGPNQMILPVIVKTILNAGADPKLANNEEITPLQEAQTAINDPLTRGARAAANLIQEAIEKKYEQKK
jgi:hypothetical protein